MYYIIATLNDTRKTDLRYRVFDTITHSIISMVPSMVELLASNNSEHFKNAKMINNKLTITSFNGIAGFTFSTLDKPMYVLLCKLGDRYKIVDYNGGVWFETEENFMKLVNEFKISNAIISDGKLETLATYEVEYNAEFNRSIADEYKSYVSKSALLGNDVSFEYLVEGTDVKLKKYTGESKEVILPSFVTIIMSSAFYNEEIESIKLNHGLKYIGNIAFEGCELSEIIIPETVRNIGGDAFCGNYELFMKDKNNLDYSKVVLLNSSTEVQVQHRY